MENQHRKISGYRELTQEEVDLMNKVKEIGDHIEEVLREVNLSIISQYHLAKDDSAELKRLEGAEPSRWLSISKTHFQEGLMAATRAVAQPTKF